MNPTIDAKSGNRVRADEVDTGLLSRNAIDMR